MLKTVIYFVVRRVGFRVTTTIWLATGLSFLFSFISRSKLLLFVMKCVFKKQDFQMYGLNVIT